MNAAAYQIELRDDGVERLYRYNGQEYPSVSKVLEVVRDFSQVRTITLEAARAFGENVHKATHLYDLGTLDEARLSPALVPYLAAWKRFLDESGAVVVASEKPVVSTRYGYAGTPDRLLQMPKYLLLPDLKSTYAVPATVGLQTAAYAKAYKEMFGVEPRRACIQLREDGTYRVSHRRDPADWSLFLSCLNVHKFNQKVNTYD